MACNDKPCGCDPCTPCACIEKCAPESCITGCLDNVKTDCIQTSKDLDLCGTTIPKGTDLTEVLEDVLTAACDGIVVTSADTHVKIDANDTDTGYLKDKLKVCSNLEATVQNIGGNESLILCAKISSTAGNTITSLVDGLFVPAPANGNTSLTAIDTTTIDTTVTPVIGGYDISAIAKISPLPNNALIQNGGLYVPTVAVNPQKGVIACSLGTTAIDTTISLVGNDYQICSDLKIDPSSTAPITISGAGLKVDCCVANGTFVANDTNSIDLTYSAGILTGLVKIDPASTAPITTSAAGIKIDCCAGAQPNTVSDTQTVDLTLTGNNITAAVRYHNTPAASPINLFQGVDGLQANLIIDPASTCAPTIGTSGLLFNCNSCDSAGDFINYNEDTGQLDWTGNGNNSATYSVTAFLGGGFLPPPDNIILAFSGNYIIIDYSNILGLYSVGDVITFLVKQICANGESNIQTHSYTVTGPQAACPQLNYGFSINVANDIVIVNGPLTVPDPSIVSALYELRVNGVGAGTGDIVIDPSGVITKVKSLVHINPSDLVEIRFKSICSCCDNITSNSGWSTWFGHTVNIVNPVCDDPTWKTINTLLLQNGWTAGTLGDALLGYMNAGTPMYRIFNGELQLRGTVFKQPGSFTQGFAPGSSIQHSLITEDIMNLSGLGGGCISNMNNANFGVVDNHVEFNGIYTYSALNPTSKHIDTNRSYLLAIGGDLKVTHMLRTEMFDDNEDALSMFSGVTNDEVMWISLEGVRLSIS